MLDPKLRNMYVKKLDERKLDETHDYLEIFEDKGEKFKTLV